MDENIGFLLSTLEQPSATFQSIYARFTSAASHNLLLNKGNKIEFFDIISCGLSLVGTIPVNGRLNSIHTVQSPPGGQDYILFITERERFGLIKWDERCGEAVSIDSGDLHDRACRPVEVGQLVLVDPASRWIAIHSVQGLVKILPFDTRRGDRLTLKDPFNIRINELQVLDMKGYFEVGTNQHNLCLLHEIVGGGKVLSCRGLDLRTKELSALWTFEDLEVDTHMLIPVPAPKGGIVVVADESLFYYNKETNDRCAISIKPTRFTTYCQIDSNGFRFLLADSVGGLFLLLLTDSAGGDSDRIDAIKLQYLGPTSIATCLSYLDGGCLFVGSKFGDSQVIKMSTCRLENGNFIKAIDKMKSLAPIVDFCLVDLEGTSQKFLYACTGAFKHGALSVVRKGISLGVKMQLDASNLSANRVFTAKTSFGKLILLSTINRSIILVKKPSDNSTVDDDAEVEEAASLGFIRTDAPTILFSAIGFGLFVQVLPSCAVIGRLEEINPVSSLLAPNNASILSGTLRGSRLVLAYSNGELQFFDFSSTNFEQIGEFKSSSSISAYYLNYDQLYYSIWENPCHIYSLLANGETVVFCSIPEKHCSRIIRSFCIYSFPGSMDRSFIFIGFADGYVIYKELSRSSVDSGRWESFIVGHGPVSIQCNSSYLVVFHDRPYFVIFENGSVTPKAANIRDIKCLALSDSTDPSDEMIIVTDEGISLAAFDQGNYSSNDMMHSRPSDIHYETLPMGETFSRIVRIVTEKIFVCLAANHVPPPNGPRHIPESRLILIDQDTLSIISSYDLPKKEIAHSILQMALPTDPSQCIIVVGAAILETPGKEPTRGSIMTFVLKERVLSLICKFSVSGCVYSLGSLPDGCLVANINGKTDLFKWKAKLDDHDNHTSMGEWQLIDSNFGQVLAVRMDTMGDIIAVGDLMKSVSLLKATNDERAKRLKLDTLARNHEANWITEVKMISPHHILASDNLGNLFALHRVPDNIFNPPRWNLEIESVFHLGEIVNKVVHGSLSTNYQLTSPGEKNNILDNYLIGTATGGLYQLLVITGETYKLLSRLQTNLDHNQKNQLGNLTVREWRSFSTDRRKPRSCAQFVDGDFIFSLLHNWSDDQIQLLINGDGKDCEGLGEISPTDLKSLLDSLYHSIYN